MVEADNLPADRDLRLLAELVELGRQLLLGRRRTDAHRPKRDRWVGVAHAVDAWSRRVVPWSLDRRATAAMVNAALGMAIDARKPSRGDLVHSDHGSQYASWTFSQRVRAAGLAHSLGTIGDAFDNAAVESFWARTQTELLDTRKWMTRVELSMAIFDWVETFHNRQRRHSSLGMLSPAAYESLHDDHASAA
jgi:putative transposase